MKKSLRLSDISLDAVDVQLLRILHQDARTSIADLARGLSMSAPSVSERLRRLKESGVIQCFTIEVAPELLGYELAFYIRVSPLPGQLSKVISVITDIEEIVECDRITGDDCFHVFSHRIPLPIRPTGADIRMVAQIVLMIDQLHPEIDLLKLFWENSCIHILYPPSF